MSKQTKFSIMHTVLFFHILDFAKKFFKNVKTEKAHHSNWIRFSPKFWMASLSQNFMIFASDQASTSKASLNQRGLSKRSLPWLLRPLVAPRLKCYFSVIYLEELTAYKRAVVFKKSSKSELYRNDTVLSARFMYETKSYSQSSNNFAEKLLVNQNL